MRDEQLATGGWRVRLTLAESGGLGKFLIQFATGLKYWLIQCIAQIDRARFFPSETRSQCSIQSKMRSVIMMSQRANGRRKVAQVWESINATALLGCLIFNSAV